MFFEVKIWNHPKKITKSFGIHVFFCDVCWFRIDPFSFQRSNGRFEGRFQQKIYLIVLVGSWDFSL